MALILVVEDQPLSRKFLSTLLQSAGHTVVDATDGADGLVWAQRTRPDLVISDILMPTVDGYEFVRRLRDLRPLATTPVIFYTATYHEREARVLAEKCGVADVLTKPSDTKTILARVSAVLAAGRAAVVPAGNRDEFTHEHLQVVSSALASKIVDFEASELRMAAIVDIAHQIAAERDPERLLEQVCVATRDVTLAQYAVIRFRDEESGPLRRVVTSGLDDAAVRQMTPASADGPTFKPSLMERRSVRLCNSGGRPEAIGLPSDHPPTFSCLTVPIASPSRVYGCLALRNKLGADEFSERDEEVALILATQAGIAYENARLYEDIRRRSASLELEVAERRRAEESAREHQARTHLAMAAAQMGVWEVDLASGRVAWSETLASSLGMAAVTSPRSTDEFDALLHPEDREHNRELFERAVRDGGDFVNEFRIVLPDGTIHWVAGRARLMVDPAGGPSRMIGVGTNISERKSLEEQLRQAQKMEAIGQLAGGIAHDFNNLLTAIRGYGDLVLDSLSENDSRRADVGEIVRAADRAAGLTRQLLAFSRKQVLQPTLVDVNALVVDTSKMLRRLIGEDIEFVAELSPDVAAVKADAGQLEQILINLAVNARDAMPNGGRLSIETANVTLDESYSAQHVDVRPGRYVMLAVSDNGTGMDEQTRRRMFEPFFTTKERGRGTGLGLATVYGIVQQSGGHVWAYGEPGLGATFKVYLPHAQEAGDSEAAPAAAPDPKVVSGTETVLLVEDEQAVRFLVRALLERAGYRVVDAVDPRDAEVVFAKYSGEIQLLVTDVIMPGSSGPSLFASLSSMQPALKVLYMSGYTDNAVINQAGLPEDVMFLQKPFSAEALLHKMREALDR